MKYLLDTHVLLWWLMGNQLSDEAVKVITNPSNTLFVSAATTWEITIKKTLGKLTAPDDIEAALMENRFESLPIRISHTLEIAKLPPIHADPFDRILIAQTIIEGLTFLTRDKLLGKYDIFPIWA